MIVEIGRNSYMEGEFVIQTEYNEPTLAITVSQLDSMNESRTYEWKLISTYNGQTEDLIDDAIFCYERDNKKEFNK